MPLKIERRPGHPGLWITGTVTPAGTKVGVRIRRRAGSDDPRIAREEASAIETSIIRNAHLGERPASRGWGEAVASYKAHEKRSLGTLALLIKLTKHFRDTPLDRIDQDAVDEARRALCRPDASPATVARNIIVPIRAVLNHAAWKGWGPEPRIKAPEIPETSPTALMPDTVARMIAEAPDRFRPLVVWFACTGARVGETLALRWEQVDLAGGRAILLPETTKAGKRRVVTLFPAAVAALAGLKHRKGHVFLRRDCEPYRDSETGGGQLRTPWATTCQRAGVPGRWQEWSVAGKPKRRWVPEVGPHGMRHTWASYHHAIWRDLLKLRDDGGWASVAQVECYAHVIPSGQEAAIRRLWGLAPERQEILRIA